MVEAALALADAEGLDAVTIRRLAGELGVTPMALYWHFADKQALMGALADSLWEVALELVEAGGDGDGGASGVGGGPSGDGDGGASASAWTELERLVSALVAAFGRHPTIAPLAPARTFDNPAGLALTERALALLERAGLDPEVAAEAACYALFASIMLVGVRPQAAALEGGISLEEHGTAKRAAIAALPAGRYPRTIAAAGWLVGCDTPEAFEQRGVAMIVGGIRSQAVTAAG